MWTLNKLLLDSVASLNLLKGRGDGVLDFTGFTVVDETIKEDDGGTSGADCLRARKSERTVKFSLLVFQSTQR